MIQAVCANMEYLVGEERFMALMMEIPHLMADLLRIAGRKDQSERVEEEDQEWGGGRRLGGLAGGQGAGW